MHEQHALILTEVRNQVGHLTLNRVSAFNAINLEMVRLLQQQLDDWAADDQIRAVVLRANGDKAFCAGGDIRELYNNEKAGSTRNQSFFSEEYALDQWIHAYSKPLIALIDGLVLGGGMGLVQGASFRIVTEHARLGMPEVAIGFFPDVGGSYFLSRMPAETGTYMGVSGNTISAADAVQLGLADWLLERSQINALDHCLDTLQWSESASESIHNVLTQLSVSAVNPGELAPFIAVIERHFAHNSINAIVTALAKEDDPKLKPWCQELLATLTTRSPLAMATTLEMLRRGKHLSLAQCFNMEYQLGLQWFKKGNFMEGVRALIVDKDKKPQWQPASIDALDPATLADLFSVVPMPPC